MIQGENQPLQKTVSSARVLVRAPKSKPHASAKTKLSVLISAPSAGVRRRLESLVEESSCLHLIPAVVAPADLLGQNIKYHPDVVLLSIDHRLAESMSIIEEIALRVPLVLCLDATPASIYRYLRGGIAGVVALEVSAKRLEVALQAAYEGLQVMDPSFATPLREEIKLTHSTEEAAGDRAGPSEHLTHREQEVLVMMGEGLSNKEIAARLGISGHTVKFHISSILGKLGAASRTEAVSVGIRSGRLII